MGLLFIRLPFRRQDGTHSRWRGGRRAVLQEFLAGARYLWQHPVLKPLTLLLLVLSFLTSGVTDLVIYHLKYDLGQPDTAVGSLLAAGTFGTLLASAAVARLRARFGFGAAWVTAFAICGASIVWLGLSSSVAVAAVAMAVRLFGTGVAGISSMSLRQEVTPDPLLGRVTSAFWTVHSSLAPLGAAIATAAAARFNVASVCVIIGVSSAVVALAGRLTPIWPRGRRA